MFGIGGAGDEGARAIAALARAEKFADKGAKATHGLVFVTARSQHLVELSSEAVERARPVLEKYGAPADVDGLSSLVASLDAQHAIGASGGLRMTADRDRLHEIADGIAGLRERTVQLRGEGFDDAHAGAAAVLRTPGAAAASARAAAVDAVRGVDDVVVRAIDLRTNAGKDAYGMAVTTMPSSKQLLDLAAARLRSAGDLPGMPSPLHGDVDGVADLIGGIADQKATLAEMQTARTRVTSLLARLGAADLQPVGAADAAAGGAAVPTAATLAIDIDSTVRRATAGSTSMLASFDDLPAGARARSLASARRRVEVVREARGDEIAPHTAWQLDDAIDGLRRLEVASVDENQFLKSDVRSTLDDVRRLLQVAGTSTPGAVTADEVAARFSGYVDQVAADARESNSLAVLNRESLAPADSRATLARDSVDRAIRTLVPFANTNEPLAGAADAVAGLPELRRLQLPNTSAGNRLAPALELLQKTADEVAAGTASAKVLQARLEELGSNIADIAAVRPVDVAPEWAVLRDAREPVDRSLRQIWKSAHIFIGNPARGGVALGQLSSGIGKLRDASTALRADGAADAANIVDEAVAVLEAQRRQLGIYVAAPFEGNLPSHAQFGVASSYLDLAEAVADDYYRARRAVPDAI